MFASPAPARSLLQVSAGLGLFGIVIGCAVLLAGCAGIDAALVFSLVPIMLGLGSFTLTSVVILRGADEIFDSLILGCLCAGGFSLLGGMFEAAIYFASPLPS